MGINICVLGLTSFLVIRMWFGKAVEDFNKAIVEAGNSAPHLIAQLSNGFTSTFFCTPIMELIVSRPYSGLGSLCVFECFRHLCFGTTTRNGRRQVIQK
jgi:uncharacterized protein YybS (DUF2232 family)